MDIKKYELGSKEPVKYVLSDSEESLLSENDAKGTENNPYNFLQYLLLLILGKWEGGYVKNSGYVPGNYFNKVTGSASGVTKYVPNTGLSGAPTDWDTFSKCENYFNSVFSFLGPIFNSFPSAPTGSEFSYSNNGSHNSDNTNNENQSGFSIEPHTINLEGQISVTYLCLTSGGEKVLTVYLTMPSDTEPSSLNARLFLNFDNSNLQPEMILLNYSTDMDEDTESGYKCYNCGTIAFGSDGSFADGTRIRTINLELNTPLANDVTIQLISIAPSPTY